MLTYVSNLIILLVEGVCMKEKERLFICENKEKGVSCIVRIDKEGKFVILTRVTSYRDFKCTK